MSLLDRAAPHVVDVQLRRSTRNQQGIPVFEPLGAPIRVRCKVEPVRDWSSAEEERSLGLQVIDMAVIYSRHWPGDLNSHIAYDGALYETVGVPQKFAAGRRTRHHRVTVKWLKNLG